MKKILVAVIAAVAGVSLMQSPAFATPEPVHSNLTCLITKKMQPIKWSAVKDMSALNKPIMYTASDIKCPNNIKISKDNFVSKNNMFDFENGEWAIVQKEWPNGFTNGMVQQVTIGHTSWDVDPYTGIATNFGVMMGSGFWDFHSDQIPDVMVISDILPIGSWNVENKSINSWCYLIYKNSDVVTRYKIKFASNIVSKFESTVSVSAKKHRTHLTVTARTSRNRPTSLAWMNGKLLKAYRNDFATLYRDGKKVKVKKISQSGKVVFNVKTTKKKHVYQVRIPANAVNFAGSASITK